MIELTRQKHVILVVEENPTQVERIVTTLQDASETYQIVAIANAPEVLAYLQGQETLNSDPLPSLILLNLNISGGSGHDLLATIKQDPNLRRIPIVILTPLGNDIEILNSYTLQGNCYVAKSDDLEQLTETIQKIEEFWFNIVTLPLS